MNAWKAPGSAVTVAAGQETGRAGAIVRSDVGFSTENDGPATGLRIAQAAFPRQGRPAIKNVLAAMRADGIPEGNRAAWEVRKFDIALAQSAATLGRSNEWPHFVPAGRYTRLSRHTLATLHRDQGETVMNDFPGELRKHLDFVLHAEGRVLVTGLGLACVVRGLLIVGRAEKIVVVERERAVIDLVWPSLPADDRLELVHADALEFAKRDRRGWDFAWHDLWTDHAGGEPHLAVLHTELMVALRFRARNQGAWQYPREWRRRLAMAGV